jgi:hypothetical protein
MLASLANSSTQRRSAQKPNLARRLAGKQTELARCPKKSLQRTEYKSVIRFIAQFLFVRINGASLSLQKPVISIWEATSTGPESSIVSPPVI